MLLKPGCELLKTTRIIGQLGFGTDFPIGKWSCNIERSLGYIDANNNRHDLLPQTTKFRSPSTRFNLANACSRRGAALDTVRTVRVGLEGQSVIYNTGSMPLERLRFMTLPR